MDNKVIYSNGIGASISQNDCCLTFVTLAPTVDDESNNSEIVDTVRVILGMSQAKRLIDVLKTQVENYEKRFGAIKELIDLEETLDDSEELVVSEQSL